MAEGPPPGAAATEPTRRLFFALWPDERMRAAMVQATGAAARASGGRPVPAENLHVTLAFLGSVPERRLAQLAVIARRAAAPVLSEEASPASGRPGRDLVFERLEYWRAAHVLCAVPALTPAPVGALARRLHEGLAECGFVSDREAPGSVRLDASKPFRPHVTLARKVLLSPRSMEMEAVTWRFVEIALVESKTYPQGAAYRILESFALERE